MLAVSSFHPAFLLRSGDDTGQAKFSHVVQSDFRRAVGWLTRAPNWDESVIWRRRPDAPEPWCWPALFPRVSDVYEFCRKAAGKVVAVDVETSGKQPLASRLICVGM